MTHILKADKDCFKLMDLKDLADEFKVKQKNNVPVRLLASIHCFVTREGMYNINQIAREEQLNHHFTIKLDPQMAKEFIFENDRLSEALKISLITRDGYYLFMDCSELMKNIKLTVNKQCFFSGNILIIEQNIACLKLLCVTPAEGLDLDLFMKTRTLMDYMNKKSQALREETASKIIDETKEAGGLPVEKVVVLDDAQGTAATGVIDIK